MKVHFWVQVLVAEYICTRLLVLCCTSIHVTNLLIHWVHSDSKSRVVPLHLLSVVADTRHVSGGGGDSSAMSAVTSRVTYTTNTESHKNDNKPDTRQHDGNHDTWQYMTQQCDNWLFPRWNVTGNLTWQVCITVNCWLCGKVWPRDNHNNNNNRFV